MYSSSTTSRKALRVGALAGLLLTTFALAATPAQAVVSVNDGVGHVDKGDVQSALKWNNGDFDRGVASLKFTAAGEKLVVDYPMTCLDLNTGAQTSGGHRLIVQPGTVTLARTDVVNAGNGRQITGFDLNGASASFTKVGAGVTRDVTCGEGTVLFMNEGTPRQPNTISVSGGLKVNGVALPNTPVG